MEFRQLRYFVGVSDAGGVLPASKILHVAQPALSQSIASLESELGVSLFHRSNKGMTLTQAGKAFLEHCQIVLADMERAKSAARNVGSQIAGEVVIGLPTTVALLATIPILNAARMKFPDIRLTLIESHSGFLKEWLLDGRLDLSLLFQVQHDASIAQERLLQERLCLVCPPQTTFKKKILHWTDLSKIELVLPSKNHGLRKIVDEVCATEKINLRVMAEIDSLPNIKKAVSAGMASTILSPGAVVDEVHSGLLKIVPLSSPHVSRTVTCATSLARPITRQTAAMIALIKEEIYLLVSEKKWPGRWLAEIQN